MDNNRTNEFIANVSSLSANEMSAWRIIFDTKILIPSSVETLNYRTAENLYLEQYCNTWESKMGNSEA